MNRQQKITAICSALTDEQREWLCEVIVEATHFFLVGVCEKCRDQGPVDSIEDTLYALAQEFRDGQD